jgi:hypothetical protein
VNGTRLWLLLFAVVAFLAGFGSGLYASERAHRADEQVGAFGPFEQAFVQEFELDPERQRLLAQLLDHYNREAEAILARHAARNHMEMEPELRRAGLEYRALVRDRLLPESQRPKFDRLMASYVETL